VTVALLTRGDRPRLEDWLDASGATGLWKEDGSAHAFWFVRGDDDAGMLRVRGPQPMVHLGFRWCLCVGISLWVPARRLAIRSDRGYLVACCSPAVARKEV